MKFRLASPHLAERFHGPLRFGRVCRGHELALRLVQLVLFVALAAVSAKLVASGVAWAVHAIAGMAA